MATYHPLKPLITRTETIAVKFINLGMEVFSGNQLISFVAEDDFDFFLYP